MGVGNEEDGQILEKAANHQYQYDLSVQILYGGSMYEATEGFYFCSQRSESAQ